MTVSAASNFRWRDGGMGDLIPLLGDGLLTTDGEYHRRARRIMLPAFHREQIAAPLGRWRRRWSRRSSPGATAQRLDLYAWTRRLALRIAMRALFGFDPDAGAARRPRARVRARARASGARDTARRSCAAPAVPYRAMMPRAGMARRADLRRDRPPPRAAERGVGPPRRCSSTRRRGRLAALEAGTARRGHDAALRRPRHDDLDGDVPVLRAGAQPGLATTLGLAPSTRRCACTRRPGSARGARSRIRARGRAVPGGAPVNYCSWASHRLPDVFPDPSASAPSASPRRARAALPKGAYVPFGGGSRTCIGMRFGQLEIRTIAAASAALLGRARRAGPRDVDPPDADVVTSSRASGHNPSAIAKSSQTLQRRGDSLAHMLRLSRLVPLTLLAVLASAVPAAAQSARRTRWSSPSSARAGPSEAMTSSWSCATARPRRSRSPAGGFRAALRVRLATRPPG